MASRTATSNQLNLLWLISPVQAHDFLIKTAFENHLSRYQSYLSDKRNFTLVVSSENRTMAIVIDSRLGVLHKKQSKCDLCRLFLRPLCDKKTIVVPIAVPRALKFRELVSSRLIKFKIYFTRNGMKNCFTLFARQQHLLVRCLLENRALNTVRLRLLNY